MGWHYDFLKIYRTKQQDVDFWNGKSIDDLPDHLQFFSVLSKYDYEKSELTEIQKYLKPIAMLEDGVLCQGYLGTLYPVALFTSCAFEVENKIHRSGWYHFVKLTNSNAKRMIKYAFNCSNCLAEYSDECLEGYLGKKNQYKRYQGKLRNIVYIKHQ